MLESNDSTTPKPLHNKIRVEEMNSSAATRKLVKSHLLILRKKRNNEAKLLKNTVTGISKWTYRNFDSNDVEDSEDRSNLIAREIIKSNSEVMILIVAKSMLKLLQNNNIQLSLEKIRSAAWNRWLLHMRSVVESRDQFHLVACVFASSETTSSCEFLLFFCSHAREHVKEMLLTLNSYLMMIMTPCLLRVRRCFLTRGTSTVLSVSRVSTF